MSQRKSVAFLLEIATKISYNAAHQVALWVERKGLFATRLTSTRKLLHHALRAKLPEMCSGYFRDQRLEMSKTPLECFLG